MNKGIIDFSVYNKFRNWKKQPPKSLLEDIFKNTKESGFPHDKVCHLLATLEDYLFWDKRSRQDRFSYVANAARNNHSDEEYFKVVYVKDGIALASDKRIILGRYGRRVL